MGNQTLRILLIGLAIPAVLVMIWWSLATAQPNGHIPSNFPHAWIPLANQGHPESLVIIPGRVEPVPPILAGGVELWPAWRCLNSRCPGRVGETPFLFAGRNGSICPRCKPTSEGPRVERWYTPEAEAMLLQIRAKQQP